MLFQNVLETKLSISIIKSMVTSSLLIACLHKTCCCPEVSDLRERAQVKCEVLANVVVVIEPKLYLLVTACTCSHGKRLNWTD